jgi:hypothetical protein
VKLDFYGGGCTGQEEIDRNVVYAAALGLLDTIGQGKTLHERKLAVVGGGPSIRAHIDTLRQWPGDIWAINSTTLWCLEQGIDAAFFTVDAAEEASGMVGKARKGVVASRVTPGVFEALHANGATVETFLLDPTENKNGPTSATCVPHVALGLGYKHVTFFGCESCYAESSHINRDETHQVDLLRVQCGPETYLTKPEFMIQAQILGLIIKTFPTIYEDKSGGLLRAFMEYDDHDVVWVSPEFEKKINIYPECAPSS